MNKLFTLAIGISIALFSNAQNYTISQVSGIDDAYDAAISDNAGGGVTATLTGTKHNAFSGNINLPFAWKFYGQTVSSYKISTSGFITFNTASAVNDTINTTLPDPAGPNNAIYAFWDNLELRPVGQADDVFVFTYGTAPKRHHVIVWESVSHRQVTGSNFMWFALRIDECGDFDVTQYLGSGVSAVSSGTIGCENVDGSVGAMVAGSPNLTFDDEDGSDVSILKRYKFRWDGIIYDADLTNTNISTTTAAGSYPIGGEVSNNGSATITSFEASYTIDNGTAVTQTISGLNIPPNGTGNFVHPTNWTATEGAHKISLTIGNINGTNPDERTCNNSLVTGTYVVDNNNLVKKVPLFEVFTSSTCPPCQPGNVNFHSIVDPKNKKDYVQIKYQQNFPSTGDPYATSESVNRRGYYSVNAIPNMQIDGGWNQNANSFAESDYTNATSKQTFFKLLGTYSMDTTSKTMSIKVRYTPLADMTNLTGAKLHVAIVETVTTKNKKTNGETQFFYVMKKMIGNESGKLLTALNKNIDVDFDTTFTFNGNYRLSSNGQTANQINVNTEHSVENFSNLRVVAWVQANNAGYPEPKYVIQAYNLTDLSNGGVGIAENKEIESSISVYPTPAQDEATLAYNLAKPSKVAVSIINLTGKVIYSTGTLNKDAGEHENAIYTSELANGIYNVMISIDGKVFNKKLIVANN